MIDQALAGQTVEGADVLIPVRRADQWVDAYWTFNYSPVRDELGQVGGVLVTFIETTNAIVAARKLGEQEEQLRFAIDAAELGTWDLNPLTNRFMGNARMKAWFGLPDDANIPLSTALNSIIDEDRQRVTEAIWHTLNPSSGGQYDSTYTLVNPTTQERRIVRARGQAYFRNDNVAARFSGTLQDITAEVMAQQQLEKLNEDLHNSIRQFTFVTDFIPQMVWSTQPDGRHDFFNQRWHDFTGLTLDQSLNEEWMQALHPDDASRTAQVWQHSLQTGAPYEIEYRMKRHDGQYRWLLGRALPLRDETTNVVLRWFGTCTDIHDQKTLSASLEQQVEERTSALQTANLDLQRSNENLTRFAYVASHDLQEPLRKIQSFGDMLRNTYGRELGEGLSYLERMQSAAGRMSVLIKDLLSFSRISTQRDSFEPVPLQRVMQDVQSDLELVIQETSARLDIGPLPTVLGDEGQLDQLFMNLISNALKFRQAGQPPHITIRSEQVQAASIPELSNPVRPCRDYHRLTVADNGIGFDEKYADQIFQVFQRLHGRNQYSGTGIGLAIVQKVVENHGGLITVASQPGHGTTFTVYLPE
ncbi:sensor histidine kinase [Spirosoma rhododendri]|uniref:histidine kinase n=1 Tax=Spirosoma rhododendri TaxID=2728024 RepID=A0A7L5DLX9_9BACT|nr:PAS domain-containing sensor histidine kinase [Spirosoma rhododendri]QJD79484.1 PAS domain-containing protein [Spirosoma rhododendri]